MKRILNDLTRLTSGQRLREAKLKAIEIGPLHDILEKSVSEPSWVG
jgi:hypothetical protein